MMDEHQNHEEGGETCKRAQNFTLAREDTPDALDVMALPDIGREWSRGERGVLRVLLDPKYFRATVPERAAAAGISERRYQQIMQRRDFQRIVADAYRHALCMDLGGIIDAAIKTALTAGGDGARDRELLLSMAGMVNRGRATSPPPAAPHRCGIIAVASMEDLG